MLVVESVAKSFDGFKAITGAGLEVEKGQVVAVIGPNGAGKTTLFNLITGHLGPDAGSIRFKGKEITGLAPHKISRLGVARSFQLINVFGRLTVFENVQVAILARLKKTWNMITPAGKMVHRETMAVLEMVGLAGYAGAPCASLSYGDQKALEVAIALAGKPELLLLDEPTAGMSPEETRSTVRLIETLAGQEGLTILFTEHDIDIVFNMAHRIVVMHQGRTVAGGTPEEVRRNPEVQKAYLGEAI
ncbi:MAG: ABC transporter ATP-binding protein [Bacillota bacterium]